MLGDHALFFSRRKRAAGGTRRSELLGWFESLPAGPRVDFRSAAQVEERLAILTCNDESWLQVVLKMSRLLSGAALGRRVERAGLERRSQHRGQS